jgi:hypothetical protein
MVGSFLGGPDFHDAPARFHWTRNVDQRSRLERIAELPVMAKLLPGEWLPVLVNCDFLFHLGERLSV